MIYCDNLVLYMVIFSCSSHSNLAYIKFPYTCPTCVCDDDMISTDRYL